jgi:hypothetical protein
VCVYKLSRGIRWSYWMTAVLLSPATLAFTVLDPDYAGLRKEILLFAGLALIFWVLVCDRLKDWQLTAMLSIFLVGLTLSHEGMLVAAPYLFAAVAIQRMSLRRAVSICAIPCALAGMALVAVVLHHGNLATAQAICSSVGGRMAAPGMIYANGSFCTGSIASLQLSASGEHGGIIWWIRRDHPERLYGLLTILTFAPLLVLMSRFYRRDWLRYEVAVVLGCTLVSMAGTGVLCFMGMDWGRWIHIQAMGLMLLAMMIDRKAVARSAPVESAKRYRWTVRVVATLALVLYVTAWTLPAIDTGHQNHGYLSLASPKYSDAMHALRATVAVVIRKVI